MPGLTADQKTARHSLIEDFRTRIKAAVWEGIEAADPALLCADDGTPYGTLVTESLRTTSLEQMVNAAARAACGAMGGWL